MPEKNTLEEPHRCDRLGILLNINALSGTRLLAQVIKINRAKKVPNLGVCCIGMLTSLNVLSVQPSASVGWLLSSFIVMFLTLTSDLSPYNAAEAL